MTTIRPFCSTDTEAVVDLWRRCGLVHASNDPYKDIERKMRVRPEWFLVGEEEGEIVAAVMVGYEGHRGWINYLAVDSMRRRRGLGRTLLAEAERLLRAEGCAKINLQVRASNAAVLGFYRSVGFLPDDVVSLGKRLERDDG